MLNRINRYSLRPKNSNLFKSCYNKSSNIDTNLDNYRSYSVQNPVLKFSHKQEEKLGAES